MADPEDFRCDECQSPPGAPCRYVHPTHQKAYPMQFALKDSLRGQGFWKTVWVSPVPDQPFEETLRIYLRAYAYQMECPKEEASEVLARLPTSWRRVGTTTSRPHNARQRALWEYYAWSDKAAMRDYLAQWLHQFGSIFEEAK